MGHALEGNLHLIFNQSFKDATEMARPSPTRTPIHPYRAISTVTITPP